MISLKNISKAYGGKKVLDNISLEINKGEIIGVLAPNGEGKTTLLKILAGIITEFQGEYIFEEEKFQQRHKNYIGYVSDKGIIPDSWRVSEAIDFYNKSFFTFNKEKANSILEGFNISADSLIGELSKGNSEKAHLALALAIDAKLYLLDEPLSSIDLINREEVIEALLENFSEEKTIIIVSHSIRDIEKILDRVIFLKDKKINNNILVEDLRIQGESIVSSYKKIFKGEA